MVDCVEGWSNGFRQIEYIFLPNGTSCVYCGQDKDEHICYRKGRDYAFRGLRIPTGYIKNLLDEYFEDGFRPMRDWEARCNSAGANLAVDSVMANDAPGDDALEECRSLGRALA